MIRTLTFAETSIDSLRRRNLVLKLDMLMLKGQSKHSQHSYVPRSLYIHDKESLPCQRSEIREAQDKALSS